MNPGKLPIVLASSLVIAYSGVDMC